MADIAITDKEYDRLADTVLNECRRIYDRDYQARNNLTPLGLPWVTCSSCKERRPCVVSVVEGKAECCTCRFKRRIKELEAEEVSKTLAYRAEQLKDFADL